MQTLTDFLTETVDSINLTIVSEACLGNTEYDKHDFLYSKSVINDLKSGVDIKVGKGGETVVVLDPNDVAAFNNEYTDEQFPTTAAAFNEMMSKYKSFPKWNTIWKGKYSGKATNTKGQRAEGLVCYMFNDPDADPELFKEQMMPDLTPDWIQSSRWTVEFINKQTGCENIPWTRDNYVACRVDGGNFKLDAKYSFAEEITSIFSGTKAMKKIFGVKCDDLYTGSKDIWNKADIVLVHKTLAKNLINDIKNKGGILNGEMLNEYLIEYTKQGAIIPISLKQLTNKDAHLSSVNIVEGEPTDVVRTVKYIRFGKYQMNKYEGSVTLVCETVDGKLLEIPFRASTSGKNDLNVEPQVKGDNSRLSKGVSIMKGILNLKRGRSFYMVADSNDAAIDELKNYGFNIDTNKSNYDVASPEVCERACCAGLLGMLKAYHEKLTKTPNGTDNFTTKFANFCVFSAMGLSGKGAFYKVSN